MNSKMKKALFIGGLAIVGIVCSSALYVPTAVDAQKTGVSADTLALGRQLYTNNCASCHSLFEPEQFTKKQWANVIPAMQKKAKVSNHDIALISLYINARAKK